MQKALDSIVLHCVQQELSTGQLGQLPDNLVQPSAEQPDEELLRSLEQCLEEKGVLKELRGLLRERLVQLLKGSWPELFEQTHAELSPLVLSLLHDFLCSHKLLFTLSVLSSELGDAFPASGEFGKLPSAHAETLLQDLGLSKNSARSRRILDKYFGGRTSLLEALLMSTELLESGTSKDRQHEARNDLSLHEKLKNIDDKYATDGRKRAKRNNVLVDSVDARFRALAQSLEREKQIQLQLAIDKFKAEERGRLRTELETELKFEFLRKEKELLDNHDHQVAHHRSRLEQEKQLWQAERERTERELAQRRDELVQALHSIRPDGPCSQEAPLSDGVVGSGAWRTESSSGDGGGRTEEETSVVADRQWKRHFLLQEAKLRTTIDKLQEENEELKAGADRWRLNQQRPVAPTTRRKTQAHPPPGQSSSQPLVDTDAVAMLRYQQETQAEELRAQALPVQPEVRSSEGTAKRAASVLERTDVDLFVAEARKRMAAIERDAQGVGTTLNRLQERRGRTERRRAFPSQPKQASEKPEVRLDDAGRKPALLKLRPRSTDFSVLVQTSAVSFEKSYSEQCPRSGAVSVDEPARSLLTQQPSTNQQNEGASNEQSKPDCESRAWSQALRSAEEKAPPSSESKKSLSSTRSRKGQEQKASQSGALIREKVGPGQDSRLVEGTRLNVSDSDSTRRQVRAVILTAAGLSLSHSAAQESSSRLGFERKEAAESEDGTDAEELNDE